MSGLLSTWFSYSGRAGRGTFWLVNAINVAVFIVTLSPVFAVGSALTFTIAALGLLVVIPSTMSVWLRRFHDRNWSGWCVLLFPLPVLVTMLSERSGSRLMLGLLSLIAVVIMIWVFAQLALLRGTRGANRFGPDPLEAPAPDGAPSQGTTHLA